MYERCGEFGEYSSSVVWRIGSGSPSKPCESYSKSAWSTIVRAKCLVRIVMTITLLSSQLSSSLVLLQPSSLPLVQLFSQAFLAFVLGTCIHH